MIASALAETLSLGAIIPFLGALADPERTFQQPLVAEIARWLNISSPKDLLLPLALGFGIAAFCSAAIRVLLLWANTRLSYSIGGDFSVECYRRTLHQPYEVHVARNSSVVLSAIAKKVGIAIAVLYQLTTLLSSLVLTAAVILALVFIDARIAILAGGTFCILYLLIVRYTKRTLLENSIWSARQEDVAIQVLQEGLGGVRDVLLDGVQDAYSTKYANIVYLLRKTQATNVFLAASPRYAMEAIGMIIISALAYVLSSQAGHGTFATALPVLGAFALGAQRLLPTLQQIYAAWAGVVGNHGAVVDVLAMLDQPLPALSNATEMRPSPTALTPKHSISMNNIRFRYSDEGPWVLNGINVDIIKGSRVGIIGSTGSGKSTVVDLFMGLLSPTEGHLAVDGSPVTENTLRQWQRCIAHVPQQIFLSDASIAENIAFGISRKRIDMALVKQAARQAQIADFVETSPEGYDAFVGERGVRLSGGQRQRIGIARALYKQASILVLDEATSALDGETENLVMQTIDGLDRNLTVLIVAHRLSTLKNCDCIVELVNGQAVNYRSYEELLKSRQADNFLS